VQPCPRLAGGGLDAGRVGQRRLRGRRARHVANAQRSLRSLATKLVLQADLVEGERVVDDVAGRLAHRIEHRAEGDIVARCAGMPVDEAGPDRHGDEKPRHDEEKAAAHIGACYGERHCPCTLRDSFEAKWSNPIKASLMTVFRAGRPDQPLDASLQALSASWKTRSPGMPFSIDRSARRPVW
jgi:hypothetical protein